MDDVTLKYSYALAKQLSTAHTLESSYGPLDLDDELRAAIEAALRPILLTRLSRTTGARHE